MMSRLALFAAGLMGLLAPHPGAALGAAAGASGGQQGPADFTAPPDEGTDTSTSSDAATTTPEAPAPEVGSNFRREAVKKVVELLGDLKAQVSKDDCADHEDFQKSLVLYNSSIHEKEEAIAGAKSKIEDLKADLEAEEALRVQENTLLETAVAEIVSKEKEFNELNTGREGERKAFEKHLAEFDESIKQLKLALAVLELKAPDGAAVDAPHQVPSGSLLAVAKKVRQTLEQGLGSSLMDWQRDTLDAFLRAAKERSGGAESADDSGRAPQTAAPDFLQTQARASAASSTAAERANAGSRDAGIADSGIADTLNMVLDTTERERQAALDEEARAVESWKSQPANHAAFIEAKKQEKSNAEKAITASKGTTSTKQAELEAANTVLTVTGKDLETERVDFLRKKHNYGVRKMKRGDEMMALVEATSILNELLNNGQTQLTDLFLQYQAPTALPMSFLQMRTVSRATAVSLQRDEGSALALSRIQSQRSRTGAWGDPFAKVRAMIHDMLKRLEKNHAQASSEEELCVKDLTENRKSKERIEADMQRVTDQIQGIDADILAIQSDLDTDRENLAKAKKNNQAQTTLRAQERSKNQVLVQQYMEANTAINKAIKVLRDYYMDDKGTASKEKYKEGSPESDKHEKQTGMATGVIGLLEVCAHDFAELRDELKTSEAQAEEAYNDHMNEFEVTSAALNKGIENKDSHKTSLEVQKSNKVNDLNSYKNELTAVVKYLETRESQCAFKGESYTERKARRESQLKALQEALDYLNGDSPPPAASQA